MIELNDSQLIILSEAANRASGNILPLPSTIKAFGNSLAKMVQKLADAGLIAATEAFSNEPHYTNEELGDFAYVITAEGKKAIGIEEEQEDMTTETENSTTEANSEATVTLPAGVGEAIAKKNEAAEAVKSIEEQIAALRLQQKAAADAKKAAEAEADRLVAETSSGYKAAYDAALAKLNDAKAAVLTATSEYAAAKVAYEAVGGKTRRAAGSRAASTRTSSGGGRKSALADHTFTAVAEKNPYRETSLAGIAYGIVVSRPDLSYDDFIAKGGTPTQIATMVKAGYVSAVKIAAEDATEVASEDQAEAA